MGVNAVHRAAPMLARIAAHEAPTVTVDGLAYRESLQVVRVEAGIANNVVPDRCEIVVNRRYAPACSFDDALAQTTALFADADEVEIVSASPAAAPNLTHPLIDELVTVGDLGVRPKLGWTDVARFTAARHRRRSTSAPAIPSSRTRRASASSGPTSSTACACCRSSSAST